MITRENLLSLIRKQEDGNISLFLPMEIKGDSVKQNGLRFKNAVTRLTRRLRDQKIDRNRIDSLLDPLRERITDGDFWQHQDEGLAVFRNSNVLEMFRCPRSFREQIHWSPYFQITPLIPLMQENRPFYLLALNKNNIRLFRGNHEQLTQVILENTPVSFASFVENDEYERYQQPRVISSGSIFHGPPVDDEEKWKFLTFLTQVENGVRDAIRREPHPLILAGTEAITARYRQVNHYSDLVEDTVAVNPESLDRRTLLKKAQEIWHPLIMQSIQSVAAEYGDRQAGNLASGEIGEVVPAARFARVDRLFIREGAEQRGTFNPDQNSVRIGNDGQSYDLINMAACKALDNGSEVYMLPAEMMPGRRQVAAIFRF